jgi:hypothetical protein
MIPLLRRAPWLWTPYSLQPGSPSYTPRQHQAGQGDFLVVSFNSEVPGYRESLYTCYQTHNLTNGLASLCSVQLISHMHTASDSKTSIRRFNLMNNLTPQTFCDPLNDVNLHYLVSPLNSYRTQESGDIEESAPASVVAVLARLDTLTMFDQAELGFDSPPTGLVVLLATAKMVAAPCPTGTERRTSSSSC